ncbi:MAG TPA: helix-turn-helix transcriptional regulator [Pseudobdellovibrionaceae bacterium]|jgi:transcriptional regulator with XRE-family HTH domain
MQSIQLVFSSNLKRLRQKRKLTQEELAEAVDCSPRYIQMLEAGKSWPRLKVIQALSKCLRVKETDLFRVK